jgi:lysozyme family protein
MAKENRNAAIAETLKWEGGYSNDAGDPGGPTNWGITIHDARMYWKSDATAEDVKAMPQSVAISIYQNKYWKNSFYDCDTLPLGVDLAIFDFGVNSGPARAVKCLGKSIDEICDYRLHFLQGLSTWNIFGHGWANRVAGIRRRALQMATGALKPTGGTKPLPKGHVATGGAIIVAGGAAAASYPHLGMWIVGGAVVLATIAILLLNIYQHRKTN